MRMLTALLLLLLVATPCWAEEEDALDECGIFRWPVKTASDSSNLPFLVDTTAHDITIPELLAMHAPRSDSLFSYPNRRFGPVELTKYRVRCRILEYALQGDRDLHMVMASVDDTTQTMIAEIPDPTCTQALRSFLLSPITETRAVAETLLIPAAGLPWHTPVGPGIYELIGWGFFDFGHDQLGQAANGIELHPVIGIRAASGVSESSSRTVSSRGVRVEASHAGVRVRADVASRIDLFDVLGRRVANALLAPNAPTTIALSRGIYLWRAGTSSGRVAVID